MAKHSINRYSLIILFLLLPTLLFAAAPSSTYTYTAGQVIQPNEVQTNEANIYRYLQQGVDTYADGSIVNADINASAEIADSKLAQITTASKVSGAALTSLASIPASAGVIPSANVGLNGIVLPSGAVFFMITGSCPSGSTDVTATYSDKFLRVNATQGSTGGSDTVTLSEANLASHTHTGPSHTHSAGTLSGSADSQGAHTHKGFTGVGADGDPQTYATWTDAGGKISSALTANKITESQGAHTHTITMSGSTAAGGTGATGSTGSGTAVTITNPYVTCKLCQVN